MRKQIMQILIVVGMLIGVGGCGPLDPYTANYCLRPQTLYMRLGWTQEDFLAENNQYQPNSKNRSVGNWGIHEQWVYKNYGVYLYFKNGILTSYQN